MHQLSDHDVVVERYGDLGPRQRNVAFEEIERVEVKTSSDQEKRTAKSMVVVAGVVIVVLSLVGLALANLGGPGNA